MRKRLLALITAGLLAIGAGSAFANDQAAHPDEANDNVPEGHCQNLGDENDGGNSDSGLDVAQLVTDVIGEGDDECDNSNGRRP